MASSAAMAPRAALPSYASLCHGALGHCRPLLLRTSDQSWRRSSSGSGEVLGSDKEEDLEAKLAAAEAEAEVLRRELSSRTGKDVDLSKLKPSIPEKRIDGTGYRESLLSVAENRKLPNDWGLTEARLQVDDPEKSSPEEDESSIVTRRLLIGIGGSFLAIGLAFFKIPPSLVKPPRPLPYYLFKVYQLKQRLEQLESSRADAGSVLPQLQNISQSADDWKDTLLSAAAWLEGEKAEKASTLAFSVYGYLKQADYNTYFDRIGEPSVSEQLEFLKFSLDSIKTARLLVDEFLTYVPKDAKDEVAPSIA